LVDLPVVDRDALLEADPDHVFTVDAGLLRQLVRRQVVGHLAPSRSVFARGTKKTRRAQGAGGLIFQFLSAQDGKLHSLPPVARKLIVDTQ